MSKSKRNKGVHGQTINPELSDAADEPLQDEQPFIGMNMGEVHEEPEPVPEPVPEAPVIAATAISEPVHLQGPFTVAGGNVLDAGGNVIAMCGFVHNRSASGPAVAGAIMTAMNRFYRHPVEVERDKP